MTLKRYMPVNCQYGAEMMEHGIGDWCDWEAVQEHVKAQRADAQREALEYIRGWCYHGLACTWMSQAYHCACEDMRLHIDAALEQLAAGERIESVSQVDGGRVDGLHEVLVAADSELSAIAHGRPVDKGEALRCFSMSLRKIVETEDLKALEAFCQGWTHQQVRDYARDVGVDLDKLE